MRVPYYDLARTETSETQKGQEVVMAVGVGLVPLLSHFSKSISQTTTFWELGLGFFGIRVKLRGKLGSKVLEKWSSEKWGTTISTNKSVLLNYWKFSLAPTTVSSTDPNSQCRN